MRRLISLLLITFSALASAQAENPAAHALINGSAQMEFGSDPQSQAQKKFIFDKTGEDSYLGIYRLLRFKHQSQCGRVLVVPVLANSHKAIRNMAMQLNICEDGKPPLETCNGKDLVFADYLCPNGGRPHFTKEVQAAVDKAQAEGGIDLEHAMQEFKENGGSRLK